MHEKKIPQWAFRAVSTIIGLGAVIMLAIFGYVLDTHTKIAVIETQLHSYERITDQVQINKIKIEILKSKIGANNEETNGLDKNVGRTDVRGLVYPDTRIANVYPVSCLQSR